MVERSAASAAEAMHGQVIAGDPAALWRGAAIDSRQVGAGEIFFALPGARVDGHQFVEQALARGAAAVVIHRDSDTPKTSGTWIRVDDTFAAMHELTRAIRAQVPEKLVGITGSAGKTTTKEMLATLLEQRFRVARSRGNLNNLYGFPVSFLAIPDDSQWMVAEMGMSTPGELAEISLLGRPDVAVMLNIRAVHLENFSTLEAIAEAKAGLLQGLAADGLIIANADDEHVMQVTARHLERQPDTRRVSFAIDAPADVRALAIGSLADGRPGSRFEVVTRDQRQMFELPIHGRYNIENCLAAVACGYALGLPLRLLAEATASFVPASRRGEVHHLAGGITLVDDCYNSNPDAAVKALESARQLPAKRYLAVLGDMLELGPDASAYHRDVGQKAAQLGFEQVVGVGRLARQLVQGAAASGSQVLWFSDALTALEWISEARPGDVILVKGSRGVRLEALVEALKRGDAV